VSIRRIEQVEIIYDILDKTNHNGFPVLNKRDEVVGIILRSQLITILKHKPFNNEPVRDKNFYQKVGYEVFLDDYPRYPGIETVNLSNNDKQKYLDLTPFMNTCPYLVRPYYSLKRVFRIFRTLGLRHIIVIDKKIESKE